ncbi:helix-turn-helix domain-containing protein [Lacimicrobium alkaliphilum]|uniref:XRE family transcriptional regulator n=1 Tax=Lacimicrobium alkaliphilum TaxID=1526571 RepID=A0A0U2RLW2_9ALTE|nr:helix-turn-helix transcriptional regulator [Lacimicrobium alkaliphilum]ALS98266.1 XRE family transcriptional regulator [Lacimicrobium alkaliphilum]
MKQVNLTVGQLLRQWRQQRRLSQFGLAIEAEISQRHLSFIESGRALPSRDMILRLAEPLDIPLRERNILLTTAGYAPVYSETRPETPGHAQVQQFVQFILDGCEPFPALAVDRHWQLYASNKALLRLLSDIPQSLLQPPINVLQLSLHPQGLAPRIANYDQWREHILLRLEHQIRDTADAGLSELLQQLSQYPPPANARPISEPATEQLVQLAVPMQLQTELGTLSLISTTTVFGTPTDVTLSELAIECFFPADENSAVLLRELAATRIESEGDSNDIE